MYQRRRQRLITHNVEDQREEIFEGLKMKLEVLHELNDVFKDDIDPVMRQQVEASKQSLRDDFRQLIGSGVSIMDLYKRFGGLMFKSDVLEKQQVLQSLSSGKEKQLVDLFNEDEKLVQRLNNLNNPLNQHFRQQLRAGPLQVRAGDQTLKQQYEKQQIYQQFAQGLVQGRGFPRGPGGGQGGNQGGAGGGPGGFPGVGGAPFPGGGAPRPGGPPPGRPNPDNFDPDAGPQGGGGGIMRQNPRRQDLQQAQQQMREFQQQQVPLVSPPRITAELVLAAAMANQNRQQQQQPLIIQQQQQPQINQDVAMALVNAMRESERKRKDRLLVVPRRQPVHQPVEEEKKEESKRPKSRTRTRTEANLEEPIIQHEAKRKLPKSKSRSRKRNVEEIRSPHFNEIIDTRSGFYMLSPNNPIFQSDKRMENEEEKFFSPRDTPEVNTQLRTLKNQIRRDETSLRRPGQSVSQTRSQNQQEIEFLNKLNERETIMQMTEMFNNFYEQLRQIDNYNSQTEHLLRTIERPLGLLKDEQSLDRFLELIFPLMDQFTLAKGVAIDQDIKEKNFEHYRGQINQALDNYAAKELNRQRLAQALVEIVMEYFEDMIKEQQKRNPPKMIAAGGQQTQRGPDPEPEQDPVVADQPTPSRRQIIEQNQDSEFKKHYHELLKHKQYGQVLEDAANAFQNQQISLNRFLKAVTHAALKYPNEQLRQEFKKFAKYSFSDELKIGLINQYFGTLLEYFKNRQQSEEQSSQMSIQTGQIPSEALSHSEINEEIKQGPQNTGVETRAQQRIGRSLLVAPRREARSTSAIRAVNKQKQNDIKQEIEQQSYGDALKNIQIGIANFILHNQASRNKDIQKPEYFFSTDTAELQKIVNMLIETQGDEQIKAQLKQEYQSLGVRSKTLQYARNLHDFLDSIRQRFMPPA